MKRFFGFCIVRKGKVTRIFAMYNRKSRYSVDICAWLTTVASVLVDKK